MIISSKEVGSQEELLQELLKEGYSLTQATLSRDLKQLKVAKAASMNGNYVLDVEKMLQFISTETGIELKTCEMLDAAEMQYYEEIGLVS